MNGNHSHCFVEFIINNVKCKIGIAAITHRLNFHELLVKKSLYKQRNKTKHRSDQIEKKGHLSALQTTCAITYIFHQCGCEI